MVTNVSKGRWGFFFLTYHPVFFHHFLCREKAIKREKMKRISLA